MISCSDCYTASDELLALTPMLHRSTVAPNVLPTGFLRTARSYISGWIQFTAHPLTLPLWKECATWMEILLCAIQGDELLIILKFPGCSEVSELVHNCPVVPDELHDVARLQVTVDQVVVPENECACFTRLPNSQVTKSKGVCFKRLPNSQVVLLHWIFRWWLPQVVHPCREMRENK